MLSARSATYAVVYSIPSSVPPAMNTHTPTAAATKVQKMVSRVASFIPTWWSLPLRTTRSISNRMKTPTVKAARIVKLSK